MFGIFDALYICRHVAQPPLAGLLGRFALALLISSWVESQSPDWPTIDFGAVLFMGWSVAFPYYLVRTRGLRGVVMVLAVLACYVIPFLVGASIRFIY